VRFRRTNKYNVDLITSQGYHRGYLAMGASMSSPDQLAGWACHTLAPFLPALVDAPTVNESSLSVTAHRAPPRVTAEVWSSLMNPELASTYSVSIRLTAVQVLESQAGDPAVMGRLVSEIQQALEASSSLCARMEELRISMINPEPETIS
jgi:hypothetical protein